MYSGDVLWLTFKPAALSLEASSSSPSPSQQRLGHASRGEDSLKTTSSAFHSGRPKVGRLSADRTAGWLACASGHTSTRPGRKRAQPATVFVCAPPATCGHIVRIDIALSPSSSCLPRTRHKFNWCIGLFAAITVDVVDAAGWKACVCAFQSDCMFMLANTWVRTRAHERPVTVGSSIMESRPSGGVGTLNATAWLLFIFRHRTRRVSSIRTHRHAHMCSGEHPQPESTEV